MKQVNIIIGRFQPITKGHMKCIEMMYNKLHIPTIIVMVESRHIDQRHPFVTEELIPIYKKMFRSNPMILDVTTAKSANIVEIGDDLYNMGYQIRSLVCGTDRYPAYHKMTTKYHDDALLSDDFELFEVERTDDDISATKLRNAIQAGNFSEFKKLFPDCDTPMKIYKTLKIMMEENLKD